MRHLLAVFTLVHGIGHLPGFAVSWRLLTTQELPYRTSILHGRLAVGIWSRSSWWLGALTTAVGISTLCCLFALPEARLGLAANAIVFVLTCAAVRFPDGPPAVGHSGLEDLWRSAPAGSGAAFDLGTVPEAGKPYLAQAIAPGTLLAASVRLRMHGEIKLGSSWQPFQAEQVIVPRRGMIWAGTVSMFGLPVRGSDQILDGSGLLLWKLLDIVPIAHAEGPDTSRSGIGRLLGETAAWLPSFVCAAPVRGSRVEWTAMDQHHIRLRLGAFGENVELTIELEDNGHVCAFSFPRWGNPDGKRHRYVDFGVVVEEERTFGGYLVPTRIRAGWYYGTDHFGSAGEFFHSTIDSAEFK
jgi:hypothetical protein